jgi:hypothetical protein
MPPVANTGHRVAAARRERAEGQRRGHGRRAVGPLVHGHGEVARAHLAHAVAAEESARARRP